MLKVTQSQKFQTALGNISVFKGSLIEAQAFEAGDFLIIFLRFWVFWGSFSFKTFSDKKTLMMVSFFLRKWITARTH